MEFITRNYSAIIVLILIIAFLKALLIVNEIVKIGRESSRKINSMAEE